MKTTILLFVFVLFSASVLQAQIEKGSVQIGGNIGFFHQKDAPIDLNAQYKRTTISIEPSAGRFYSKNKLAGFFLNYYYDEQNNSMYLLRQFGGGIFFRQYLPVINRLYVVFSESAGYNYQNGSDNLGSVYGQVINLSCNTGMAYDIAKKMQLELLINNLLYANYTKTNRTESYNIGTSLEGNSFYVISLGFRFYLK